MHVLKFGGTSMGDEHTWRKVMEIIGKYDRPVVVVSATARTTRRLLAAAEYAPDRYGKALEISSEIRARHEYLIAGFLKNFDNRISVEAKERCLGWIEKQITGLNHHLEHIHSNKKLTLSKRDAIASIGEQLSSFLFAECGRVYGMNTTFIDARKIIKTDSDFGKAAPLTDKIPGNVSRLKSTISKGSVPVIGGYYGENEKGELTTMGFEGSDYSASLIGAALDSDAIEIWTDVSGIFTCDPRVVEDAVSIPEISFREATEMAYFGAKVLHPSTLKPAAGKKIPVYVKNIFDPEHPGTKIYNTAESKHPVRALTFLEDVVIITVTSTNTLMGYHFLSNVFEILERHHITIDVVTTTEASVSIALQRPDDSGHILEELKHAGEVRLTEKQGLISLIGFSVSRVDEMTSRVFSSVKGDLLSLISFSRNKKNLNLVLPEDHLIETVKSIHHSLFNLETSV